VAKGAVPTTQPRKTYAEASGKSQSDASLDDCKGLVVPILDFKTEPRTYEGKETRIGFITFSEPVECIHNKQTVKAKTVYTWSETVLKQLDELREKGELDGKTAIECRIGSGKGTQGGYLTLE